MKLNAELRRQLLANVSSSAAAGDNFLALVDDACELLTGQIVLWLKARQRELKERRAKLPLGDPEANVLAAQMRTLGEAIVALAEAP